MRNYDHVENIVLQAEIEQTPSVLTMNLLDNLENAPIDEKLYSVTKLDAVTWYLWDKSKSVPTPHYYKSEKAALKKIKSILKGVNNDQ